MMGKFFYAGALLLIMSRCGVTNTPFSYRENMSRAFEPDIDAKMIPLTGNVKVIEDSDGTPKKIDKTYVFKYGVDYFSDVVSAKLIATCKSEALSKASMEENADLLVAPLLNVNVKENIKTSKATVAKTSEITVRVTGYPAVYVNFRPMTNDDEWMLNHYYIINGQYKAKIDGEYELKLK